MADGNPMPPDQNGHAASAPASVGIKRVRVLSRGRSQPLLRFLLVPVPLFFGRMNFQVCTACTAFASRPALRGWRTKMLAAFPSFLINSARAGVTWNFRRTGGFAECRFWSILLRRSGHNNR
jgi:hypothetical protein